MSLIPYTILSHKARRIMGYSVLGGACFGTNFFWGYALSENENLSIEGEVGIVTAVLATEGCIGWLARPDFERPFMRRGWGAGVALGAGATGYALGKIARRIEPIAEHINQLLS